MRAISKILTASTVAAAALALSACGSKTETTTDNTTVVDMNSSEGMDTSTDNMTAVDGASNSGMMATDNGGMMAGNDTMMTTNSTTTTTTNAM